MTKPAAMRVIGCSLLLIPGGKIITSLAIDKTMPSLADKVAAILGHCVDAAALTAAELCAKSPISGEMLAHLKSVNAATADDAIESEHLAFLEWRLVPAPKRGELIRLLGEELRAAKNDLGRLVSIEGDVEVDALGEGMAEAVIDYVG